MKKIKSIILGLLMTFTVLSISPVCSASEVNQSTAETIATETAKPSSPDVGKEVAGLETVTIDDLEDKIDQKGDEVISIGQLVASKVLIVAFIISCILALIAAISKKGDIWKFIIAMILTGLLWAMADNAKEIITFIGTWAKS